MRYVTTRQECKSVGNRLTVKIYKELKLEAGDWMLISAISLTFLLLAFCIGLHIGRAQTETVAETVTEEVAVVETVTEEETETYSDDIPLSYAEQQSLRDASEEFGVDYYVMLGLIEQETDFRNIAGDNGNASGYCQVWRKWWSGKMNDIGAEDLNIPEDNFRTACAIIRELTDRYGSTAGALTAYNKGSYDGRVSSYASSVLQNAEKWRKA